MASADISSPAYIHYNNAVELINDFDIHVLKHLRFRNVSSSILQNFNQILQAETKLQQAIAIQPNVYDYNYLLGNLYSRQKKIYQKLKDVSAWDASNPTTENYNLPKISDQQIYEKAYNAIQPLKQCILIAPQVPAAYYELTQVLSKPPLCFKEEIRNHEIKPLTLTLEQIVGQLEIKHRKEKINSNYNDNNMKMNKTSIESHNSEAKSNMYSIDLDVESVPTAKLLSNFYFLYAECLEALRRIGDNHAKAILYYTKAIELEPNFAAAYYSRALSEFSFACKLSNIRDMSTALNLYTLRENTGIDEFIHNDIDRKGRVMRCKDMLLDMIKNYTENGNRIDDLPSQSASNNDINDINDITISNAINSISADPNDFQISMNNTTEDNINNKKRKIVETQSEASVNSHVQQLESELRAAQQRHQTDLFKLRDYYESELAKITAKFRAVKAEKELLANLHDRESDLIQCISCLKRRRSVTFLPCMHLVSCDVCAERNERCPAVNCNCSIIEKRNNWVKFV
jgi:tetratricopeptide (TPR) repeat protein